MAISDVLALPEMRSEAPAPGRTAALMLVFTAAIFSSATLIFWVEPLFAKMILPMMGGAPAVWITALMFYQAVLFAGYLYAHALATFLPPKGQMAVHAALLGAAGLTLPLSLPTAMPAAFDAPEMQVLALLAAGVGLPLFALSATAPLLQKWFAGTDHPNAGDPYFLYAASNVGSLGALLAFPLLLEPTVGGHVQAVAWAVGFALAAVLVLGAAGLAWRSWRAAPQAEISEAGAPSMTASPVEARLARTRLTWMLLAAVPSSLLSGTTTRISTDIAAGPLFWVVPLALYLVTFILAFSGRRPIPLKLALPVQAVLLAPVVVAAFGGHLLIGEWLVMGAMLLLLFVSAYLCHLRLAESRPAPARLTEFYLWIAAGGMLGGTFNALVAPFIFSDIREFPLALILAVALRPNADGVMSGANGASRRWRDDLLLPASLGVLSFAAIWLAPAEGEIGARGLAGVVLAASLVLLYRSTRRLALMLAVAFVVAVLPAGQETMLHAERNFFGIARVYRDKAAGLTVFVSGSTLHGLQSTDPSMRLEPTSYFHRRGPLGDVFRHLGERVARDNVAVIGMGVGTMACYGPPSAAWLFYEINPVVLDIATDSRLFTFLNECQKDARLILGDGRLKFAETRDRQALIILDAFSADSVPAHLLTREAFALYLDRLAEDGVLVANVSNRFVDLRPTLATLARHFGLHAASRRAAADGPLTRASEWVVMSPAPAFIDGLKSQSGWKALEDKDAPLWTDDHTDILGPMLARMRRTD